jgi:hypothetical protein
LRVNLSEHLRLENMTTEAAGVEPRLDKGIFGVVVETILNQILN